MLYIQQLSTNQTGFFSEEKAPERIRDLLHNQGTDIDLAIIREILEADLTAYPMIGGEEFKIYDVELNNWVE